MEAFVESHKVALKDPVRYQTMSRSAYQQMQQFASLDSVCDPLAAFLGQVLSTVAEEPQDLRIVGSLAE